MQPIIDTIWQNKEWIFSGIGISIIATLFWLFRRLFQPKESSTTSIEEQTVTHSNITGSENQPSDQSVIYQANSQTIYHGMTYKDVESIATRIFEASIQTYTHEARDEIERRSTELRDEFTKKMKGKSLPAKNMADPGMQYAFHQAQSQFVRTGDKDLLGLLVDLLIHRQQHANRSVEQIAIDAAIKEGANLTQSQFNILTLKFVLSRTIRLDLQNRDAFAEYVKGYIIPFLEPLQISVSTIEHLYSTRTVRSLGTSKFRSLPHIMFNRYPGLFSSGFTENEWKSAGITDANYKSLLIPCLNDKNKLQIAALTTAVAEERIRQLDPASTFKPQILRFLQNYKLNEDEIQKLFTDVDSKCQRLFNFWNNDALRSVDLTTTGIAIGYANLSRLHPNESAPLTIWISE
ncbi:MAG: hypothetical protein H7A21_06205 [Spirochaetales bacterium]|nr:hypothetical protein [Leptospiraceae bacterium]MCP5481004.1 hypothetical protein [Spirochaetales bacterium]MCP5485384.1 hypothetical protein [Spirochaetales bacterium]